jgi:hypothetical protein
MGDLSPVIGRVIARLMHHRVATVYNDESSPTLHQSLGSDST